MFELIAYKIVFKNDSYHLKVDILNTCDKESLIQLKFVDSIFGLFDRVQNVNFKPKTVHWVSWEIPIKNVYSENNCSEVSPIWGAKIKLYSDRIKVKEFNLKFSFSNLDLRLGMDSFSTFNKKKFWIIGDSHPGYYTNIKSKNYLITKNYDIISLSIKSLTLHNFLTSDWKTWLNYLPIFDDDILCFDLGEIDLRCGIFLTSKKKNENPEVITINLLNLYFEFIQEITKKYKKKIVILSPNRPIKDNFIQGNSEYYKMNISNVHERLDLWNLFNSNLEYFCHENSITFWDIKKMFTDIDGTLYNEVLIENDIHFKVKKPILFDLKHKIMNSNFNL